MNAEKGKEKSAKTFARMGKNCNQDYFTRYGFGRGREWLQDLLDEKDGHWYDYATLPYDSQNAEAYRKYEQASKMAKKKTNGKGRYLCPNMGYV